MFAYRPHFIPSSIILVGAGGTGSRLMSPMVQLVKTCLNQFNPAAWIQSLPIYVIDGDEVEEKNLVRQCFLQKDVGSKKSMVVAHRYSNAFGVPVYGSPDFIKEGKPLDFPTMPDKSLFSYANSILILAVDSADARREILNVALRAAKGANIFVIDAGNEDAFGQIRFFTNSFISSSDLPRNYINVVPKALIGQAEIKCIPMDYSHYATLGSSASEISCEDLPQTLAINNMMAALLCSVLQNFLHLKTMPYDGIRFSLDGGMSTDYLTPRRLIRRGSYESLYPNSSSLTGKVLLKSSGSLYLNQHSIEELTVPIKASINAYAKAGLIITPEGDAVPKPVPVVVTPEEPVVKEAGDTAEVKKPRVRRRAAVVFSDEAPPVPAVEVPTQAPPELVQERRARVPASPPPLRTGA